MQNTVNLLNILNDLSKIKTSIVNSVNSKTNEIDYDVFLTGKINGISAAEKIIMQYIQGDYDKV